MCIYSCFTKECSSLTENKNICFKLNLLVYVRKVCIIYDLIAEDEHSYSAR